MHRHKRGLTRCSWITYFSSRKRMSDRVCRRAKVWDEFDSVPCLLPQDCSTQLQLNVAVALSKWIPRLLSLSAAQDNVNAVAATVIGNLVARPEGDSQIGRSGVGQDNVHLAYFFRLTFQGCGTER